MIQAAKLTALAVKYWYVLLALVVLVVWYFKKKKVGPENKDENANKILDSSGIKGAAAKGQYKAYAAQIANALGTAYPWYDPRRLLENDEKAYELVKELSTPEFNMVKKLYFESYAKGRDLSTDLANLLDDKYYSLLRVK